MGVDRGSPQPRLGRTQVVAMGDGYGAAEVAIDVADYDDGAGDSGSIGDDGGADAQVDSTFVARSGAERVGSAPPNPETVNVRESQCLLYI